ncbi:hypothetical protein NP493_726g01005 [Ridgeia piscesae]|uniref:Uncharacterized protein n=1 Tax=Ridgeia piscesae TaxID=27915 RepID=A0AAD9KQM8_RIDPI|nr:hypothetical protein NP493_726g01005 [Ridgeia piscesae]
MKISSIIKCYQGKNIESNKNITGTHAFRRESYAHIYIHTHIITKHEICSAIFDLFQLRQ